MKNNRKELLEISACNKIQDHNMALHISYQLLCSCSSLIPVSVKH